MIILQFVILVLNVQQTHALPSAKGDHQSSTGHLFRLTLWGKRPLRHLALTLFISTSPPGTTQRK